MWMPSVYNKGSAISATRRGSQSLVPKIVMNCRIYQVSITLSTENNFFPSYFLSWKMRLPLFDLRESWNWDVKNAIFLEALQCPEMFDGQNNWLSELNQVLSGWHFHSTKPKEFQPLNNWTCIIPRSLLKQVSNTKKFLLPYLWSLKKKYFFSYLYQSHIYRHFWEP